MYEDVEGMKICTIECQHCGEVSVVTPLNWTTISYGFILLSGEEDGYIGITCPNQECLHTTLMKENLSTFKALREELLKEAEYGPGYVKPLLRYRSFPYGFDYPPELDQHRFNYIYKEFCDDPQAAIEAESFHILSENDMHNFSGFYWPYFWEDLAMGPAMHIPFFRGDGIEQIVNYENKNKTRVFPRYMPYDEVIQGLDTFSYCHLFLELEKEKIQSAFNGARQTRLVDEYNNIKSLKEAGRNHDFLEILTTPADQTRKNTHRIRAIQEEEEEQPTTEKSMEDEVAGYFNKGFGKSFLEKRYLDFIQAYVAISKKAGFSAQAVETLRTEYLIQIHGQMRTEFHATKQYAFYEEPPTWTIIFDGKPIRSLRGEGFRYIQYLVSRMREGINVFDLNDMSGIPMEALPSSDRNYGLNTRPDDDAAGDASNRDRGSSGQKIADEKYLRDLVMTRNQLRAEFEKAKKNADLAEQERISRENEKIEAMISDLLKPGADEQKFRGFRDETDKVRDKIGISIRRAVNQLIKYDKKAGSHFKKAIKPYSNPLCYDPREDLKWHLK